VILRVQGVDALYQHLRAQGLNPSTPQNAEWGERYFEISDPEGDVISFAELLNAIQQRKGSNAAGAKEPVEIFHFVLSETMLYLYSI
jgi:hypothetical protein